MSTQPMSLEEFESACRELSTEALSMKGSMSAIKKKLPDFFQQFKDFVNSRFFADDDELDLGLLSQSHYKKLAKQGEYMNLRRAMVMVPTGLNVTYLEHLTTLERSQDFVDKLMPETLEPFERMLGTLLTHPDTLKSQRESGALDEVIQHDLESLRETVANDFSRDGAERRPYGQLLDRQKDWDEITERFNGVSERLLQTPRHKVVDLMETIVDHLNTVIQRMDEDPEEYAASGVTVSSLAKMSYHVASEVEYYSIHAFMLEQLQASIEDAGRVVKERG